jgi:hypothetical protein
MYINPKDLSIKYENNTLHRQYEIQGAIINNDPLEEKLNVIVVISNPCEYKIRYTLAKDFITKMEKNTQVRLYVVELVYNSQKFIVTQAKNPRHLQIQTDTPPIWSKENMINLGTRLLPDNWKAFAWVDGDIEFENPFWAIDVLKVLNGCCDVIQCFSHALDLNKCKSNINIFSSFGYQYATNKIYNLTGINYFHPGYAWAITRKAYEKIGGIYQDSILGSGDHIMALAFTGNAKISIHNNSTNDFFDSVVEFEYKAKELRLGYIPGVIRHFYHGTKANRKYKERWQILTEFKFSPKLHLKIQENGLLVPSPLAPVKMIQAINEYFHERKEDE